MNTLLSRLRPYIHIGFGLLCILSFTLSSCKHSHAELETMLKNPQTQIIDVRTLDEFQTAHIPNALHMPYDTIETTITTQLPIRDTPIILYCRSGKRAEIAKTTLTKMGYSHVINAGGYTQLNTTIQSLTH